GLTVVARSVWWVLRDRVGAGAGRDLDANDVLHVPALRAAPRDRQAPVGELGPLQLGQWDRRAVQAVARVERRVVGAGQGPGRPEQLGHKTGALRGAAWFGDLAV